MPFFARLYLKYYLNCFHVNDILILLQIHDIPPMQQSETTNFLIPMCTASVSSVVNAV